MTYSAHMAGQILAAHLEEGELVPGEEVGIRIDQTLTQDATGTLVYLEFMSLGIDRVQTGLSVSYVDHNVLQTRSENGDDHLFLQSAAARHGVYYSRPGNGISHQVHLARFGVPGQTLLGSDSHTPTGGGLGMLAMGAGGLDVAIAMAGGLFYMKVPQVMHIRLSGELPPWVGAKDVILYILKKLTVKGGLGKIIEYGGPGAKGLSVPERATITNMGAELGAWTSIFPADEESLRFLAAQGREKDFSPISPGKDAEYDEEIEINLSSLEPLVACPHSPDAVRPVRELLGQKVDQVVIGSCTNTSYRDLKLVSEMLRGKKVHSDVSLSIAPGSRQILSMLAKDGGLADLVDAGARILEVACGPCIGMGQVPPSGGVSLRTFNRNFPGRSGTPNAQVYLSGPQVAAAAALTGHLVSPGELGDPPEVRGPENYPADDAMIIPPPSNAQGISIRMGPNIKPLPELGPLPDTLELELLLKLEDNVSTDDILMGGVNVLSLRSNLLAISEHVFALKSPGFVEKAKIAGEVAILAGQNYGQGSSREHAALAPRHLGVRAVLALSFARLHRANLINFGVIPLLVKKEDHEMIEEGDVLEITGVRNTISESDKMTVKNAKKGLTIEARLEFSKRERKILLAGGRINLYRQTLEDQL